MSEQDRATPAKPPSDEERVCAIVGEVVGGMPYPGQTFAEKLITSLVILLRQVRAEASQEALACQDCREYRAKMEKASQEKEAEIERLNEVCLNLKNVLRSDEEQGKQWAKRNLEMQNDLIATVRARDLNQQRAGAAEAKLDALREENARFAAKLQRVLDWIRFQANSESGIGHEIEAFLAPASEPAPEKEGNHD